jgi:DNA gyrase inhibitor GyrI
MKKNEMRIVEIGPMSVASFHGYGASPETIAFEQMKAWLAAAGVVTGVPTARVFGFNNPSPTSGSPNYGYEFWVELPADSPLAVAVQNEPEVAVKRFDGGRYAALAHEGTGESIPAAWKRLVELTVAAGHETGHHQWLEEHFIDLGRESEVLSLDCLAPIG